MDLAFHGNIVRAGGVHRNGYLGIEGGKVVYVGIERPDAANKADHSGKPIFPGAIDAQVHSRSQKGREGFEFSTKAAAAGGFSTIVDMPFDEGQLVCSADAVAEKAGDVAREAHVDVALYGTIHPKQGTGSIAEQVEAGVCAFKFSTFNTHPDRFPRIPPQLMSEAFAEIAKHGLAAGVHNENDEIVRARMAAVNAEGRTDYLAHGLTHTPLSELLAMAEIYEIGAYTGCPAHVVHCSLGRGIDICESYKRQGFAASVEVCIHYLCFAEDIDVKARGGLAKINLRTGLPSSARNSGRIWRRAISTWFQPITSRGLWIARTTRICWPIPAADSAFGRNLHDPPRTGRAPLRVAPIHEFAKTARKRAARAALLGGCRPKPNPDAGAEPPLQLFYDKPTPQNHRRKTGRRGTES